MCEGSNCFPPPAAAQVSQQERLQAVMLEELQGTESPSGQLQAAAVGPHPWVFCLGTTRADALPSC